MNLLQVPITLGRGAFPLHYQGLQLYKSLYSWHNTPYLSFYIDGLTWI
jgi:hypothetical protein